MAVLAISLSVSPSGADAQKTEKLFNGKDLLNWNFVVDKNSVPADQVYSVKEGVIDISGTPFGYMYTKDKYGDFKLHAEYRWPAGKEKANSGIFLMINDPVSGNAFPNSIECNLMQDNAGDFVLLSGSDLVEFQNKRGEPRPAFPVVRKANPDSEKPAGEWNDVNVFVKNGVITVYINGVYQNTGTCKVKEGHIGLQSEGKEVQFRNVTLTEW